MQFPVASTRSSAAAAIGCTPLVNLSRITEGISGTILAKLEYLNPGFSKKDRAALQIIDDAERDGSLSPGQTVIELTSGNMGTGLAIVCAIRGYPFIAVMSRGNSNERARMMRALGADVVLVEQCSGSVTGEVSGDDLRLVEDETRRLARKLGAYRADQFVNESNRRAHYFGTAPEIWQQSSGSVTAFCDFAGSGGTFAGCGQYFREQNPAVRCYLVEPEGAAVLSGEHVRNSQHPIQGGGYAMSQLAMLRNSQVDGFLSISTDDAIECTRRLAREEGIFAGFSTGANLAAALKILHAEMPGATVAMIACDSGLKYLSTDLWA